MARPDHGSLLIATLAVVCLAWVAAVVVGATGAAQGGVAQEREHDERQQLEVANRQLKSQLLNKEIRRSEAIRKTAELRRQVRKAKLALRNKAELKSAYAAELSNCRTMLDKLDILRQLNAVLTRQTQNLAEANRAQRERIQSKLVELALVEEKVDGLERAAQEAAGRLEQEKSERARWKGLADGWRADAAKLRRNHAQRCRDCRGQGDNSPYKQILDAKFGGRRV
jgi:hypothetical protein